MAMSDGVLVVHRKGSMLDDIHVIPSFAARLASRRS
jgi:hypothetical protein